MDINDLKDLPYKRTRMSPTKEEIFQMIDYMQSSENRFDNFLEFGCGVSTFFLSQLKFKNYIAIEDYSPAIEQVTKYCPNVNICTKWEQIPTLKYNFVFVDSHAGGDALGHERHKPFQYAIEHNLLLEDTIMFAHDHTMVNKGDFSRLNINEGWHGCLNKYKWTLVKQIKFRKNFGIYKITEHNNKTYLNEEN
ncbi:MAG TPA: hypothetical protein VMX17_07600 [Candidatus Glassbacteria bacterium]|nr:hypothetical protein [Candidatus Glassbacteria bacterium]